MNKILGIALSQKSERCILCIRLMWLLSRGTIPKCFCLLPVLCCRAFGKTRQWEELANLAKSKKSAIGFGPFVDVCIEAGAPAEANRSVFNTSLL